MLEWNHDRYGRPPTVEREVRRAVPRLLLFGVASLVLLLATSCSSRSGAGGGFLAEPKPLSNAEQAAFQVANRKLILEDVAAPRGTTLSAIGDTPNQDDDHQVTGLTTTFRLSMPETGTPTVDAWRAAHPNGPTPSAELDAAFDADVYRPAWLNLDEVEKQLRRLGFRRETEPQTGSLANRTVSLRKGTVTIWLGIGYPNGRVTVYRHS